MNYGLYYGSGDSFLFKLRIDGVDEINANESVKYPWIPGNENYFLLVEDKRFAIGGKFYLFISDWEYSLTLIDGTSVVVNLEFRLTKACMGRQKSVRHLTTKYSTGSNRRLNVLT